MTLSALSLFTTLRLPALIMAALLVFVLAFYNVQQLREVLQVLDRARAELYAVRDQMQLRPADPWPRGSGHVVLAVPGSREIDKAYHEPGGSFSPSVGSFGVSLWLFDRNGTLIATSDSLSLAWIRQELIWNPAGRASGIMTETPYYRAEWTSTEPGRWRLRLRADLAPLSHVVVAIRSVGP
ncbi:MAG: hypothetical protein C4293_08440, partial [Nitrospiraceae bacterium]